MYRLTLKNILAFAILLPLFVSADEPHRPPFSWDTVPLYAHFGAAKGLSADEVEFIATHYNFIALEKNHGFATHGDTEAGTLEDVQRIRAINPDATILYYWNLLLDYPFYESSAKRGNDPSWFIHNADGTMDRKGDSQTGLRKFDLSNPELRAWWVDTAAKMLKAGNMNGVFVDALPQVSARPQLNQKKWGVDRYHAIEQGIAETLKLLKQAIGTDTLVIYNGIRSVPGEWEHGGLKYLRYADGVIVEHFNAFRSQSPEMLIADMERVQAAGEMGKVVIVKAFPGFSWLDKDMMAKPETELLQLAMPRIQFPLAAFLIVAQPHFYFNYTWGYQDMHGAYAWYPEFDHKLGPPKGDARRDGFEFWREFEHASVYINAETKEAQIDWR